MEDQKKHIDDLFRQQLNDYQEAPRAGVWDRIEDSLDKIDTANKPGNKETGGSRGLLGYSIALLLLAVAAFFIFKQSHQQSLQSVAGNKAIAVNNTVTKENKADNTSGKNVNNADKATITTTNSIATNKERTARKPTSANTPNSTGTKSIKHVHIASHSANRVAGRKVHHAVQSINSANNSNIVAVDQQSNKDKANVETNAKTEDKAIPSAYTPIAKAVTKKSRASNNVNPVKVPNPEKTKTDKTKNTASTENNKVDQTAVAPAPSASLPVLKKAADKTKADIAKKEKEEHQVKKETAGNDKNAEKANKLKKSTEINNGKKLTAAEKKTQVPVNNSSAILPESKPVAANKNEEKEMLKQKEEESKQEEPAKNTADTNIADNNTKNNAAASGGGSDDIAHRTPFGFNLQAGVKLGYEQGFSQYTTSKFLGAVYAQVGLSDKFAIMLQPAIKYTQLNKNINNVSTSYYNNTGIPKSYKSLDSSDSLRRYYYYDTYDSIIVRRQNTTTSYLGFEVPVMLKYKVSNSFSILGGVNIDISNLFTIGDKVNTIHLKTTPIDSMDLHKYEVNAFFDTLKYRHPGVPYSSYTPASSATQTTVRLGYMLGIDYSLADKFTLEFLVTQSLSGYNNISDNNIKSLYSQPYFRLSVGYRFLNISKKKTPYNGGL